MREETNEQRWQRQWSEQYEKWRTEMNAEDVMIYDRYPNAKMIYQNKSDGELLKSGKASIEVELAGIPDEAWQASETIVGKIIYDLTVIVSGRIEEIVDAKKHIVSVSARPGVGPFSYGVAKY